MADDVQTWLVIGFYPRDMHFLKASTGTIQHAVDYMKGRGYKHIVKVSAGMGTHLFAYDGSNVRELLQPDGKPDELYPSDSTIDKIRKANPDKWIISVNRRIKKFRIAMGYEEGEYTVVNVYSPLKGSMNFHRIMASVS